MTFTHSLRCADRIRAEADRKKYLLAIKAKCLDCCVGQHNEVKLCSAVDCVLHEHRLDPVRLASV
jgi:hypothetical protein